MKHFEWQSLRTIFHSELLQGDTMPRKRRGWIKGACYHITHRCHNQEFLFRYAKYRNFYVRTLFSSVQRYHVDVLRYGRISGKKKLDLKKEVEHPKFLFLTNKTKELHHD